VGANVVLRVKGSKGRIVKKLSGAEDLFKGLNLPDMREKDLKQVLLKPYRTYFEDLSRSRSDRGHAEKPCGSLVLRAELF
jgi:hypothetical protein